MIDMTETTTDGESVTKEHHAMRGSGIHFYLDHLSSGVNHGDTAVPHWELAYRPDLHEAAREPKYKPGASYTNGPKTKAKRKEQVRAERERAAFAQACLDRGESLPLTYPEWIPPLRKGAVKDNHPLWGWVIFYTGSDGSQVIAHPYTKTKSFLPLDDKLDVVEYGHYDEKGNIFSASALFGYHSRIYNVVKKRSD